MMSIVLRLLLCIGLILNGSSPAVASARMHAHALPVVAGVDAIVAPAEEGQPCHAQGGMGAGHVPGSMTPVDDAPSLTSAASHDVQDDTSDCCGSMACQCIGASFAPAAFDARVVLAELPQALYVSQAVPLPLSPALQLLIRPPIG